MNKHVYSDAHNNQIRISAFQSFEGSTHFNQIAAKFVVSGAETYVINGKKFLVKQGEYVIGNNNQYSEVHINQQTVGLCIDIAPEIITEITDSIFDTTDFRNFILSDKFLINKYKAQHTHLGHQLNKLSRLLLVENQNSLLSHELFYSIGESIVRDQSLIFEQFSKLRYKKQLVNETVFRNLLNAKTHIDDNFLKVITITELTQLACMSKYDFIRRFKSAFLVTPFQYLIKKRLLHAKLLLLQGEKVSQVALLTGFADTAAFSKAFKNQFGCAPSQIKI
mgnify:CR=1 FL=1